MKYYDTTLTKYIFAISFFILIGIPGFSQTDLSSPYSVFGQGIPSYEMSVSQAGMGGSGSAFLEFYKMNRLNPAVLAYYMDPIFETSALANFTEYKTKSDAFRNKGFKLDNISLAAPIQRGVWGVVIGLEPYTNVGYEINSPQEANGLSSSPVSHYSGEGGINQAFIGTAYRLYYRADSAGNSSSLAFGARANRIFGTISHVRQLSFPGNNEIMGVRVEKSTFVRGWNGDFGLHYQTNLIKRSSTQNRTLKLLLGATYGVHIQHGAERNAVTYNFIGNPLMPGDTIAQLNLGKGTITRPQKIQVGMGLDYVSKKRSRYRFAFDYSTQQWSDYKEIFQDQTESFNFRDNKIVSTGFEYTPDPGSMRYLQTVEYRLGFRYEETPVTIDGTDIRDVGMSFGLSLPLHHRRAITKSAFHISMQYGKYGTTENNLIQENYIKIFFGFSFTPHFRNRWFVQPKYD